MCFIPPGRPWTSGFVDSFRRGRRYECLQRHVFDTRLQARALIGGFRGERNLGHLYYS
ncbi:integrase core domain-containing protein [Corynebacterium choanae]|uniref:integrase core domain-containing protein n=1 Tax=Corynebacterium choanae TaxID=1862358 RepID=UPI000F50FEA9